MNAWQLMLLEKVVSIAIKNAPNPADAYAAFVAWVQEKTNATVTQLDDLLVPLLRLAQTEPAREVFDDVIDWLQMHITQSENQLDDLALPLLDELERSFGDSSD